MIVLDASAAADACLEREDRGLWAVDAIAGAGEIHAPHLIDTEVVSALRRFLLAREIARPQAQAGLELFARLALERHPAAPLRLRIWELRTRLTAYDATYVALAEALGLPLVTTDDRLARADGHRAEIVAYDS